MGPKFFLETGPTPPPPLSKGLEDQPPPPHVEVWTSTAIIEHDQKLKKKDLYPFSTIPKLSCIFISLSVARKPIQQYTTYEQSYVMVK